MLPRWSATAPVQIARLAFTALCLLPLASACLRKPLTRDAALEELRRIRVEYSANSFVETARKGNSYLLEIFLDAGMDPNAVNSSSNTALMEAAAFDRLEAVKLLLGRGADLSLRDKYGRTALLHCAGASEGTECIRVLIDSGANVNDAVYGGRSALMQALTVSPSDIPPEESDLRSDYSNTYKLLIERGADVNAKSKDGTTPTDVRR
jgi:ankyrin repeat protein